MANTKIAYQELRIDVRDPELTQVYVAIDDLSGEGTPGVQGWHHKTFPASMSMADIFKTWADGEEEPLLWPLNAPPS